MRYLRERPPLHESGPRRVHKSQLISHIMSPFIPAIFLFVPYVIWVGGGGGRGEARGPKCHNLQPPPSFPVCECVLPLLSLHHTHTHTGTPAAHLVLDSHCALVLSGRGQMGRGRGHREGSTFSSEADFEIVIIIFKASKLHPTSPPRTPLSRFFSLSHSLSLTLSPSELKEMKVCLCSIPCYITSMH